MSEIANDQLLIETINKNENKRIITASIAGKSIGHISYTLGYKDYDNELDIETIGVDDIHQRRGIARIMLEYLIADYGEFTINSGASNDAARLLQESVGFITIEPYRLKREGTSKYPSTILKDVHPMPVTYAISPIFTKVDNPSDLEKMYQLSRKDLSLLKRRLEVILSSAYDGVDGYSKTDYTRLYNMIEQFINIKLDEQIVDEANSKIQVNESVIKTR